MRRGYDIDGAATYHLRRAQSHSDDDPTPLAGTQCKSLLDTEGPHHLQGHFRRVPVRVVFGGGAGGAMAERLNGEEVDGICEGLAAELLIKQGRGCAHGVDEDDGGLCGVDVDAGQAVAGADAAQMGYLDGRLCSHVV